MFNKKYHAIYMAVYFKYDNNIMPQIPKILVSYLMDNPDKIKYYLNDTIHIGMILERLSDMYSKKKEINILDEIIEYVEVELCKTTLKH